MPGSLNDAEAVDKMLPIKQSVANIRAQAELVYNADGYSYLNVCSATSTKNSLDAAQKW